MQDRNLPKSPRGCRATPAVTSREEAGIPNAQARHLAGLALPSRDQSPTELGSVPPVRKSILEEKSSGELSWDVVIAKVDAACPMRTDPERLAIIQEKLLAEAEGGAINSGAVLKLDGHPIGTRALAEAVSRELEKGAYEPTEIIEAAVQVYLRGSFGQALKADAYSGAQAFVYSPRSGLLRRGMFGDGTFAHGAALAQLLSDGRDGAAVLRSLLESGKIAHLVLWARGMPPHFMQDFVAEAISEACRKSSEGAAGPLAPEQFMDRLLVHVAIKLDKEDFRNDWERERRETESMSGVLRIVNKAFMATLEFLWNHNLIDSLRERKFVSSKDASPFSVALNPEFSADISALRSPRAFFRFVRNEIAQAKMLSGEPPIAFSDLLGGGEAWMHADFLKIFDSARKAACSKAAAGNTLRGKKTVRSFFPDLRFQEFENAYDVSYGTFPHNTEVPEQYADLIVTEDWGDAFAFNIVLHTLRDARLLRDEDDLEAALKALRERLFAERYEHSRLKVAVYSRELISAAREHDGVSAWDTFVDGIEASEIADGMTNADSAKGLERLFAGLDGPRCDIPDSHRFLDFLGNLGQFQVKESAVACCNEDSPKAILSQRVYSAMVSAICAHPLAATSFTEHLLMFTNRFGKPKPLAGIPTDAGFFARRFQVARFWSREVYINTFVRLQYGADEARLQLQQLRTEKLWGGFFKCLAELPSIGAFSGKIKATVTKGAIVSRELQILYDFFQLVSMPCAAKFLFLHYRATRLGLNCSAGFPVRGRFVLPGTEQSVAFPSRSLQFKTTKEFEAYVKRRSAQILLHQNDFFPENECDLELFALACRLYRTGLPPEEVTQRTLAALLPHWKVRIDGEEQEFGSNLVAPSPFDELIRQSDLASQCLPVLAGRKKVNDDFCKALSAMRDEGAEVLRRFEAQHAAVAEVSRVGPFNVIAQLEERYGVPIQPDEGDASLLGVDQAQGRLLRLVRELSATNRSLSTEDAERFFYAHAIRGLSRERSVSYYLEHKEVLEKWVGLLELIAEGVNDPCWADLLNTAAEPLRCVLETITDVSHLQNQLMPLVMQEDPERSPLKVHFCLTRGPTSHFIGAICDTCARESLDEHPNKAFITFSLGDDDASVVRSFFGGCVVMLTRTKDGEPAVVIRGFNPQMRLEKKASIRGLYDALLEFVVERVAKPLGIKQVLAPYELVSGVSFSNRPLTHLAFKERHRHNNQFVALSDNPETTYNNADISGRCIRIWPLAPERLEG